MDVKEIKIRNKTYMITDKDVFMNNGSCIQILTKKEKQGWFQHSVVLTKKAASELGRYQIDIIEDNRFIKDGVKKGYFNYKLTGAKSMGSYDNTKF